MIAIQQTDVAAVLREQIPEIIAGTFFISAGFLTLAIAAIRRLGSVKLLVWLGVWTTMFGGQELLKTPLIRDILPLSFRFPARLAFVSFSYLVLVAAALTFLELTTGAIHFVIKLKFIADLVVAILGIGSFLVFGSEDAFLAYNGLLAASGLVVLFIVTIVPALSRRYLVLPHHRVLTIGMFLFTVQALHVNLLHSQHLFSYSRLITR